MIKPKLLLGRNQFIRYTEKLISILFKNLFDVDILYWIKIYKSLYKKYISLASKNLFLVDFIFFCKLRVLKLVNLTLMLIEEKIELELG